MWEQQVPQKKPGDSLYAAEVNILSSIAARLSHSQSNGRTAFYGASFVADASLVPWQQITVKVKESMKDSEEQTLRGLYYVQLQVYNHDGKVWETQNGANDPVFELDANNLGVTVSLADGDLVVCYWDDQRGMFVPAARDLSPIPFALSDDLIWTSETESDKRYWAWPVDKDYQIVRDTKKRFYVYDPLGQFRGCGTSSTDSANQDPAFGFCREWGSTTDSESGDTIPIYVIVGMQPAVQSFLCTVASRKSEDGEETENPDDYGPYDDFVWIDSNNHDRMVPVGGIWPHPNDLPEGKPDKAYNIHKDHFTKDETVQIVWCEERALSGETVRWCIQKITGQRRCFKLKGDLTYPGEGASGDSWPYVSEYEPSLKDAEGNMRLYYPKALLYENEQWVGLPSLRAGVFVTADLIQGQWNIDDQPQTEYWGVLMSVVTKGGIGNVQIEKRGNPVTVEAWDKWLCESNDTIPVGTVVIVRWFEDQGKFYIVEGDCCEHGS